MLEKQDLDDELKVLKKSASSEIKLDYEEEKAKILSSKHQPSNGTVGTVFTSDAKDSQF